MSPKYHNFEVSPVGLLFGTRAPFISTSPRDFVFREDATVHPFH